MTTARQRLLVIVLSFCVLALIMPASVVGYRQQASYGVDILRADSLIRGVVPGSAAALAGIEPGDRVGIHAMTVDEHLHLMYPRAGARLDLVIEHGGTARTVSLVAADLPVDETVARLILGEFISSLAFVVVGTVLVFLRPSPMTWWLWLYCILIFPVNEMLEFYSFLPERQFANVWLVGRTLFGGFSVFPLLPFALRFPHERITGWRARWRGFAIASTVVAFVYYALLSWRGLHYGVGQFTLFNGLPALALYALVAGIIVLTYYTSHGVERQRLKWAVFGMLIAFTAEIAAYVPGPAWLSPLAGLISIVMPLTVAYATLRHRLIAVDFVVNRALAYGLLTAALLVIVSLIDWLTARFISEYHLALYVEAGSSIGLGFALNRLHQGLESFLDRLFFRERHRVENRMELIARSLPFARRVSSIEKALVDEPERLLKLASAALFRRTEEDGPFVRSRSTGWSDEDSAEVDAENQLVRTLMAERRTLTNREAGWAAELPAPHHAAAPNVYVPIFCRQSLSAVAVYGAHRNGTSLDPAEIALLSSLAPGAGVALDQITFETLRKELDEALRRADIDEQVVRALTGHAPQRPADAAS